MDYPVKYYFDVLSKYATFDGRARRAEYWYFVLFNIIISIVLSMISEPLSSLYSLAVLIPGLAVGVRRLHDIDKSGWMLLIAFIPLIGIIWLIILLATDGNPGENKYGADPKATIPTPPPSI